MECRLGDEACYIAPGDLLIARAATLGRERRFPLQHYHGAIVRIDMRRAPRCLSCFLQDVTVQPEALAQRLCGHGGCFIARWRICLPSCTRCRPPSKRAITK